LTESMATKYFGNEDPIGQPITYIRDGMDFQLAVGAIMKDPPSNTHFKPDFIANCIALNPLWVQNNGDRINSWGDSFSYSFIRIEPGTDLQKVSETLQGVFDKNLGEESTRRPLLTPLREIHFTTGQSFELDAPGDKMHLYIFGSIGLLILGMACINYMNLATARSIRRSKEVGLRKTLGVSKASLIAQFLGESFLMTAGAFMAALILFTLFLPSFNALTLKHFSLSTLIQSTTLYMVLAAFITVGLVSGSYPAFYLSGFKPIKVLKGNFLPGRGPENFRKVFVVAQICITLLLLTGTYVVRHQLQFIDQSKLSEFKDQIVTVRLGDIPMARIASYKQLVQQHPGVLEISTGPHLPRRENFGNMARQFTFRDLGETIYSMEQMDTDFDFPSMFHLEFIAGRSFSKNNSADSTAIIINEKAVADLGVTTEKALGLQAEVITYYEIEGKMVAVPTTHKVIGVVKDFTYASAHNTIGPIAICGQSKASEMMYIKLENGEFQQSLDYLLKTWKQVYPATPFQYWFMDEEFGRLYRAERQMGELFIYLSAMAIFIACLGLFGLASFTAEQKIKEIGIRKVLGASTFQVMVLLTSRYVKLALIAFLIGIPLAVIAIRSWMATFVYKAELGIAFYIWSCVLIISITIFTVGVESLRAARANPSESMRHE
ncbi:MAG: hypothetical protein C0490_09870, partial [Marivirga sp.]|nr:hypothetical protein [Marivirga sp.]